MIPLHIDVKGKKVIVVGGGKIAYRRLCLFLAEGANITVISPNVISEIEELFHLGKITWLEKKIELEDLKNAFFIIAATNDASINEWIAANIEENQLINIVSNAKLGNVTVPKTVKKGKLILSVSTSGASPKLSKEISEKLIEQFEDDFIEELDKLYVERELNKKGNSR
ncbi:NAD(P)-dependent oxidoreductase [Metabacillus niabensis]|uniref:precorrin-2 dehydrogenase n=1 Tax=Metabacillus niabensis TaxID=324854 RepID=A0ABT9Z4G9_9BACI|nr:NAD(P)-dependent oxidoreductase [Metabacillus niabensis]MDQ0227117.1 precorrin-2 dehydrogenase/sirohydrochlorin ferrochelatase [Metabacillus niabensis]